MWRSLLLLLIAAAPAYAHHGAAAYDLTTPTTLEATITAFEWRNPHALIEFTVKGEPWTAETAGLIILNRAGWTRNSLKANDRVTITGFRARNGSRTMILRTVTLADGTVLNNFVPNLAGVWMVEQPRASFSAAPPPPMTPWAQARFAANRPTVGPHAALDANDPTLDCEPPGVPYILVVPTPFEYVEAPGQIVQLFEYSHFVRRIYTDGRTHPDNLQDTGSHEWLGHSVGHWDGETLVIETIGFNDRTWLDRLGRPHSDALRVVERVTPVEPDRLDYRITVYDEKAYTAPWEGQMTFRRRPDWAILEHTCVAREDPRYREYRTKAWQR